MPDRKIAIWIAVSSEDQAKRYSLDAQLADCRAFVSSIPERYKELAEIIAEISMADTRSVIEFSEACTLYPHSYGILSDLIKRKKINVLICIRRDRLGREESLIMTIEALCRKHGVKIVAIKSSIPSSLNPTEDEGSGYVVAVEAVAARIEIQRLQDRRESGMIGRVADERLFPGMIPWGYSYVHGEDGEIKQIVMDGAVRLVVRYILIDLFLQRGMGHHTIAETLNAEQKLSPRGERWTRSGVRSLIENAARYAGWLEYNREGKDGKEYVKVKGTYEPMLTEAEYQAIEGETESRKYHKQHRQRLLSGIVACANCKYTMYYRKRQKGINRPGEFADYLVCTNPYCNHKAEIVETKLIAAIEDSFLLLTRSSDEQLIALAAQEPVDTTPSQERLDGLLADMENTTQERARAIKAFISLKAITEDEFADQMKRLDSRLASLTSAIEKARRTISEEQKKNESVDRLREIRTSGLAILAMHETDPALVNRFLRQCIRLEVAKGRDKKRRIRAKFL